MELKEKHSFLPQLEYRRTLQYPDVNFFLRKRYFVSFMTCLGYVILYILRANLSIAIVEMTSKKNITLENGTIIETALYDWDSKQKGFIISLFSYGYFGGPVGGILTIRYGGVTIFGVGLATIALLSALSPFLLRLHFIYFAAARVLEGFFESFSEAALLNIFVLWAPPNELSRLTMFASMGAFIGIFCNHSICGLITYKLGIDAVFTITGGLALAWYVIWLMFISNSPLTDRFITARERNYFRNFISTNHEKKKPDYPWKKIFTSKPAWAMFNEFFCSAWMFSFIGMCLPLYIKDIFNVNIQTIGYTSSIPILANILGIMFWSFIADYIRSNKLLSIPTVHRLFLTIGQLSSLIFFIMIGLGTNFVESIMCFTLMRLGVGAADISYQVIFIDMFGKYNALVRGLCQVGSNISWLLNPTVMGLLVSDHSRSSWNLYFLFLSSFNIFSLIIFYRYGSGKLQEWADPRSKKKFEERDYFEQFVEK